MLIIIGGWFFWFQWRPSQIRSECSWIHKHTDAVPAKAGLTQEEVDACKEGKSGWDALNCDATKARPAEPADDWWQAATVNEYNFCIHSKGL